MIDRDLIWQGDLQAKVEYVVALRDAARSAEREADRAASAFQAARNALYEATFDPSLFDLSFETSTRAVRLRNGFVAILRRGESGQGMHVDVVKVEELGG